MLAERPASGLGSLTDVVQRVATVLSGRSTFSEEWLNLLLDLLGKARSLEAQPACDPACLTTLAAVYNVLDIPMLADREGMLGQIFQLMSQLLSKQGTEPAQVGELISFLQEALGRAPLLHRRVVARLLREVPRNTGIVEVLGQLAKRASQGEDFDQAEKLYAEIISRMGQRAGLESWLDWAEACFQAINLACGEEALHSLQAFSGMTDKQRGRLGTVNTSADKARELIALPEPKSLEQVLSRAGKLDELGRSRDARRLLERVRAEDPRDARPLVGLAKLELEKLRMRDARALIRQASGLEHRDLDFYELAVGTLYSSFLDEVLTPMASDPEHLPELLKPLLADAQREVDGLMAFAPSRAEVLRDVLDALAQGLLISQAPEDGSQRERILALIDTALPHFLALQAKWPREAFATSVLLVLARLTSNRVQARRIVLTAIPAEIPQRPVLRTLQANILLALAVDWSDRSLLPELQRTSSELEAKGEEAWKIGALQADVAGLQANATGRDKDWARAEEAYRKLLGQVPAEERCRILSNLGVTLFRQGKKDGARRQWQEALAVNPSCNAPDLLLQVTGSPGAGGRDRFEELLGRESNAVLKYQARFWQLALFPAEPKEAARLRSEAFKALDESGEFSSSNTGEGGAYVEGKCELSLGYSSSEHLITRCNLAAKLWLILQAPPAKGTIQRRNRSAEQAHAVVPGSSTSELRHGRIRWADVRGATALDVVAGVRLAVVSRLRWH